ncbi:MAG: hypothetical protein KDD35_01815 [Bdellovibrionales bacterium]|nr:hypothetical protein [Bdellovibrionales bacterium]
MTKLCIIGIVIVLTSISEAKSYFDAVENSAVIYFMQDENTVNALYCLNIEKSSVWLMVHNLKSDSSHFDENKCQKLSIKGITLESIKEKVPMLKQQLVQALVSFGSVMGDMIQGFTGDKNTGREVEDLFSRLTDPQKALVAQLDAESVFDSLVADARNPYIESVNSQKLKEEIEYFQLISEPDEVKK